MGVEGDESTTSLKRGAEGVEKLGGMFSLAVLSEVGSLLALDLVDLSVGVCFLFLTIRVDDAVRFVTDDSIRES